MTQKEKDLLLKDLAARLPYGVKCNVNFNQKICVLDVDLFHDALAETISVKPYLRPMSSMTEEEEKIYNSFINCIATNECGSWELVNWLNANQFDYHGLIPKGLSLEAPEDMYDIN